MTLNVPSFAELLKDAQRSAVHLEMRDMTHAVRQQEDGRTLLPYSLRPSPGGTTKASPPSTGSASPTPRTAGTPGSTNRTRRSESDPRPALNVSSSDPGPADVGGHPRVRADDGMPGLPAWRGVRRTGGQRPRSRTAPPEPSGTDPWFRPGRRRRLRPAAGDTRCRAGPPARGSGHGQPPVVTGGPAPTSVGLPTPSWVTTRAAGAGRAQP